MFSLQFASRVLLFPHPTDALPQNEVLIAPASPRFHQAAQWLPGDRCCAFDAHLLSGLSPSSPICSPYYVLRALTSWDLVTWPSQQTDRLTPWRRWLNTLFSALRPNVFWCKLGGQPCILPAHVSVVFVRGLHSSPRSGSQPLACLPWASFSHLVHFHITWATVTHTRSKLRDNLVKKSGSTHWGPLPLTGVHR